MFSIKNRTCAKQSCCEKEQNGQNHPNKCFLKYEASVWSNVWVGKMHFLSTFNLNKFSLTHASNVKRNNKGKFQLPF